MRPRRSDILSSVPVQSANSSAGAFHPEAPVALEYYRAVQGKRAVTVRDPTVLERMVVTMHVGPVSDVDDAEPEDVRTGWSLRAAGPELQPHFVAGGGQSVWCCLAAIAS